MAKVKMSMTSLRGDYTLSCGYGDLQHIAPEMWIEPDGYNCGVYGWNCDIYRRYVDYHRVYITTGYRNMRGPLIPAELVKEYSARAEEIRSKYAGLYGAENYRNERAELEQNFDEFTEKALCACYGVSFGKAC